MPAKPDVLGRALADPAVANHRIGRLLRDECGLKQVEKADCWLSATLKQPDASSSAGDLAMILDALTILSLHDESKRRGAKFASARLSVERIGQALPASPVFRVDVLLDEAAVVAASNRVLNLVANVYCDGDEGVLVALCTHLVVQIPAATKSPAARLQKATTATSAPVHHRPIGAPLSRWISALPSLAQVATAATTTMTGGDDKRRSFSFRFVNQNAAENENDKKKTMTKTMITTNTRGTMYGGSILALAEDAAVTAATSSPATATTTTMTLRTRVATATYFRPILAANEQPVAATVLDVEFPRGVNVAATRTANTVVFASVTFHSGTDHNNSHRSLLARVDFIFEVVVVKARRLTASKL